MSTAEIFDRGYRKFDGERAGLGQAVRSVSWHTIRSILGIGRKGRHKVFPIIISVIAFLPSVGFLALAVLIGDLLEGELQPEYWELFGLPIVAVVLFATLVAPEAIVRDRRDGMLRLYLSTPLTKPTYLAAKFIAVMSTMAIVVAGPVLLFLVGNTIQSLGPDGFGEWIEVLVKVVLSSLIIVLFMTSVSLAWRRCWPHGSAWLTSSNPRSPRGVRAAKPPSSVGAITPATCWTHPSRRAAAASSGPHSQST